MTDGFLRQPMHEKMTGNPRHLCSPASNLECASLHSRDRPLPRDDQTIIVRLSHHTCARHTRADPSHDDDSYSHRVHLRHTEDRSPARESVQCRNLRAFPYGTAGALPCSACWPCGEADHLCVVRTSTAFRCRANILPVANRKARMARSADRLAFNTEQRQCS